MLNTEYCATLTVVVCACAWLRLGLRDSFPPARARSCEHLPECCEVWTGQIKELRICYM